LLSFKDSGLNSNDTKPITNQIWFINAAAIGEGLVLGKKAGVDLLVLWEALKNSVGDTFVVRHDVPSILLRVDRAGAHAET
jgi:3-hydroxyisobutyrate dehydrogenase-like beta-hydroxyacid dehydrogenase